MIATFVLGFLFGLRHALDADHIAAVASLATRSRSPGETVRVGIAWGLGHGLTLLAVSAVVLVVGLGFSQRVAELAEFLVGIMLVGLGLDVLRRAVRDRLHVHGHAHGGLGYHVHLHSHAGDGPHAASPHDHAHRRGLAGRALLVGLMHGLAGSAALLLLAVAEADSIAFGLLYVVVFGIGATLGMAALSFTIAYPMRASARFATWGLNGLNVAIGLGTTGLGGTVIYQTAPAVAAWLSAA